MRLNVNYKAVSYFDGIKDGECFAYNGSYYIKAYDNVAEERFGVNLSDGNCEFFEDDCQVQKLTATVTFKEIL